MQNKGFITTLELDSQHAMVKSLHGLMFVDLETSSSPGEMSQQQLERLIRKVLTFVDATSIEGEDTTMLKALTESGQLMAMTS